MGSVAIGALVIGTSMLVVFAVAMATLNSQVESGLSELESAAEPLPSFTIDDATNIGTLTTGAVVDYTINTAGTAYVNGAAVINASFGSFSGTIVTTGGIVTEVTISNYGSEYVYAESSTYSIELVTPQGGSSGTLDISVTLGNIVHTNITNDGSVDLDTDRTWLFTDGLDTRNLSDQLQGNLPDTIFPGDTFHYYYYTGAEDIVSRIAVTAQGVTEVERVL